MAFALLHVMVSSVGPGVVVGVGCLMALVGWELGRRTIVLLALGGASAAGLASAALVAGATLPGARLQPEEALPITVPLALAGFVVAAVVAIWPRVWSVSAVRARWAYYVLGAVAIVGGLWWADLGRPVLPVSFCGGWGHRQFDAALWRQTDPGVGNLRAEMVRSLLRDWRPRGRTRQQIVDTLGDPGSIDFAEAVYEVGWVSGWGIDPDYLVLHFDGRGRCDDWWLYQG